MLYLRGVFYCYNEIENVVSNSVTVIAKQILVCRCLKIYILSTKMSNTVADRFFRHSLDLHNYISLPCAT